MGSDFRSWADPVLSGDAAGAGWGADAWAWYVVGEELSPVN